MNEPYTTRGPRRTLAAAFSLALAVANVGACGASDDGDDEQVGSGLTCAEAIALPIGGSRSSATRVGKSESEGSCNANSGTEVFFAVDATASGMLDLTLTPKTRDLGLYVRSTCGDEKTERGCAETGLAGVTERLSVAVTAGERVYVVVDGYDDGQAGQFTLSAGFHDLRCGDGKAEGPEECDPPDGGKTCTDACKTIPEVCTDGVDNDGDTLVDCEDVESCAGDAACALASACAAAATVGATTEGDTQAGSSRFAGSCTGQGLGKESLFTFTPEASGALALTLQAGADLGLYARTTCTEASTEIGCRDDGAAGAPEVLVVPVAKGAPITAFIDAKGGAAGPFALSTALTPSTEVEPNDTTTSAMPQQAEIVGTILPAGDVDVVAVTVPGPKTQLRATVKDFGNGDCAQFRVDSTLELLGPDGVTVLAVADDAATFCADLTANELGAGTHYLRVAAAKTATTPVFAYRLTISLE